jgi:hypothetical protein
VRVGRDVVGVDERVGERAQVRLPRQDRLADVRIAVPERGQHVGHALVHRGRGVGRREDLRLDEGLEDVVPHLACRHVRVGAEVGDHDSPPAARCR